MRDKFFSAAALAAAIFAGGSVASADSILLKNGNVIQGKIVSSNDKEVTMAIKYGDDDSAGEATIEMKFDTSRIKQITRDGESSSLREGMKRSTVDIPAPEADTPVDSGKNAGQSDQAKSSGPAVAELDESLDPDLAKHPG